MHQKVWTQRQQREREERDGKRQRAQCQGTLLEFERNTQESAQRLIFERENKISKVGNYNECYATYILYEGIV